MMVERRGFIKKAVLTGGAMLLAPLARGFSRTPAASGRSGHAGGEILYNGIRLPEVWPPRNMDPESYDPMPVPYLDHPPRVIPVDTGRQLFVDDFLIEHTNLRRVFHRAVKYEGNPVLLPETPLEMGDDGLPLACPKDGGVWWDPDQGIFRMWYEAGWIGTMAYATSRDGIHWDRPGLDITPGTNQILPGFRPDSTTVFPDPDCNNPGARFKMFLRPPNFLESRAYCMISADGIHWSEPVRTNDCGDRSTMFYNPFRRKWVYSIRSGGPFRSPNGRARYYHECSDFMKGAQWNREEVVYWTGADRFDPPDPGIGEKAQLYNLSAVAYESLMLGFHQIHLGPPNEVCRKLGIPKITELKVSFSRDGFHWYRPDREPFIAATRKPGDWDRGYVQSVGGICTITGDKLRFYYIGFKGDENNHHSDGMKSGMYAHGSTGMALLRRDGFASMYAANGGGSLVTRPLTFSGKYLFVNADCPQGEMRVEILDEKHNVIRPFSAVNCVPVTGDSTLRQVRWKRSQDVSALAGKKVRFRFYLENGHLYAFWVSPDRSGASYGYMAAGGPGYTGNMDDRGDQAYQG